MDTLQRWLIVIAIWVFAVGIFLQALHGRYRLPILADDYVRGSEHAMTYYGARYDTWTGRLETTYLIPGTSDKKGVYNIGWKDTPTCWVKELK